METLSFSKARGVIKEVDYIIQIQNTGNNSNV